MAGGDTYLIIYLKLQLKAIKSDGILKFDHLESTIAEELALDIDENVDNVKVTLSYLVSCGLAETNDEASYLFIPYAVENVGSEGSSAQRMREARERKKLLPAEESVTLFAQSAKKCANRYGEIEIEKEIDKKKVKKEKPQREIIPPEKEWVEKYCRERGNHVDVDKWYDFYESKGWKVGKDRMRNWQASIRTWERNDKGSGTTEPDDEWKGLNFV